MRPATSFKLKCFKGIVIGSPQTKRLPDIDAISAILSMPGQLQNMAYFDRQLVVIELTSSTTLAYGFLSRGKNSANIS
jgi:hypothetical protein